MRKPKPKRKSAVSGSASSGTRKTSEKAESKKRDDRKPKAKSGTRRPATKLKKGGPGPTTSSPPPEFSSAGKDAQSEVSASRGLWTPEELEASLSRIRDFSDFLVEKDLQEGSFPHSTTKQTVGDPTTDRSPYPDPVWGSEDCSRIEPLRKLLNTTSNALLNVIRLSNGKRAVRVARLLISNLVATLQQIQLFLNDREKCALFEADIHKRFEFPALVSAFPSENSKQHRIILEELKLAGNLPFAIDPRRPLVPINHLLIRILLWIDINRRNRFSPYLKVAPDLQALGKQNINLWEAVIEFHLDFFQSHGETIWKKSASRFELRFPKHRLPSDGSDPYQRYRSNWIRTLILCGAPVGDVTEWPEFKAILEKGTDTNVKSKSTLYNRVKHKVLESFRGLMS
jgi:hypothetical protein